MQANGTTAAFIGSRSIYAPAEYSYHCQSLTSFQDALLVSNNTNTNTSEWRLDFVDFQVQLCCCLYILVLDIPSGGSFCCSLSFVRILFYDTDSGLRFGQQYGFLLRQRLRRLLQRRDLDGAADLSAHAVDFRVWSALDHAFKHHGSIRRPQRPMDFSTSVGVKRSTLRTPQSFSASS